MNKTNTARVIKNNFYAFLKKLTVNGNIFVWNLFKASNYFSTSFSYIEKSGSKNMIAKSNITMMHLLI